MTTGTNNSSKRGLVGAIVAAVVASACCVGPLIVLALGLGGAWVGNLTALEPYRPFFMAITLIFLGYAFYRVYRKPAAEACETGSYCANPKSNTINKISLWVVTVLVIGLLAFPYVTPYIYASSKNGKSGNQAGIFANLTDNQKAEVCESCVPEQTNRTALTKTDLQKIILNVPDMYCPACPITVSKSLKKLDGVKEVNADLETKKVIVIFDASKVEIDQLKKATENVGYPSTVVKKESL